MIIKSFIYIVLDIFLISIAFLSPFSQVASYRTTVIAHPFERICSSSVSVSH